MAFSQADLDAINEAIASGAKRVRFQTHEVEYQSVAEMLRARDLIRADVDGNVRAGVIFTEFGTGA